MSDTVKRTEPIWLFGSKRDFRIYDCGLALNAAQYMQDGHGAARHQKNQIVLHFTAGNNPGRGTVEWWNTCATNYFCPKWPTHDFQSPHPGDCPEGHGTLKTLYASSNYVVERATHREDTGQEYVDVIEVVDSDYVTWHGESVNMNSIGIENANVGPDFHLTNDDTFTGNGANKRPTDRNHWIHMARYSYPGSNLSSHDFQAYQEEQYLAMILLLRSLCIKHRIARRFLGDSTAEKFARWHNRGAAIRSRLMRFRGILSHMNCHDTKECGSPAMHRNRLFRGIIDEWWMPIQLDGAERPYYMGPFDLQPDTPSFFRWSRGALQAELFHDCDMDALQETKSYFDLNQTQWYFTQTENPQLGGLFPIGTNRVWHAGVHFKPPDSNPKVYAAASGTIVAARLGSEASIENDPEYGSQRFLLIRHCVYWQQEAAPSGEQQINYSVDPSYFFTLYMHLSAPAKIDAVDNGNPPWFNYWRRRNADADASAVFCPNVPVYVGDWIGGCGSYRGNRMLHFEVMSKDEITVDPWAIPARRVQDLSSNVICDVGAVDKFVKAALGHDLNTLDVARAARDLHNVKSYHKSEWALEGPAALQPVLPDDAARRAKWARIKCFMWVAEAVAACPDLSQQLCTATGMMWHYHPITFMEFVNRLILRENGQVDEPDFKDTNVEMESGFLTHFVNYSSGPRAPAAADGNAVKPFLVSDTTFQYHFTRSELACTVPVTVASPHVPAANPPTETRFHVSLLDALEDLRQSHGGSLTVKLSQVCSGHNVPANVALCATGAQSGLDAHAAGLAIDIRPAPNSLDSIRKLWSEAHAAARRFQATCSDYSGAPSRGDLQGNVQSIEVLTDPAVAQLLNAGRPLTSSQIQNFVLHLELRERARKVQWLSVITPGTAATSAEVSSGNIIGSFISKEAADKERVAGTPEPWFSGFVWQCVVKKGSQATSAAVAGSNLVGSYPNVEAADAETVAGTSWPVED
jgi:hypothetical protein